MVFLRLIYIFGFCISSILAACPSGQWCNGASLGSSCLTYFPPFAVCTTCSAGYYCAGDNTQIACSPYTYSDAGSSTCLPCGIGYPNCCQGYSCKDINKVCAQVGPGSCYPLPAPVPTPVLSPCSCASAYSSDELRSKYMWFRFKNK